MLFSKAKLASYGAWVISLAGLFGSLYFSEVRHFAPCVLCWWQRVLLYPLVLLIPIGIIRRDAGLPWYILPFSILGIGVAGFHTLLQQGILPEAVAPCVAGVSCITKYVNYFGFITIPFLSLLAFIAITLCMVWLIRQKGDNQ